MVAKFTRRGSPFLRLAAKGALRSGVTFLALAIVSVLLLGGARPALAVEGPTLDVSPAQDLDPEGVFVVVGGRGFEPDSQLFLMQCRNNSGEDHTCNSVGLQKVATDANGNFPDTRLKVTGNFGSTDCTTTPCAVKTSAVSGHADNRSLDVLTPLSFQSAAAETASGSDEEASPSTVAPDGREMAGGRDDPPSANDNESNATWWVLAGSVVGLTAGAGAI